MLLGNVKYKLSMVGVATYLLQLLKTRHPSYVYYDLWVLRTTYKLLSIWIKLNEMTCEILFHATSSVPSWEY